MPPLMLLDVFRGDNMGDAEDAYADEDGDRS